MQQWVYSNLHDINGIWAWEKLKALMTWPQSWRKQFAVLFGAIRGIFQNALLPKLCGIPIFIQGMERRTKAGKLKQSYLSKVLFRIFHKNHQMRFLFLINNITGTKESYWMRFFVMMLPLSLVGFFYEKYETNTDWNCFFVY